MPDGGSSRAAGPAAATFVDGVQDMAVLDAVRRSAAEGGRVEVAELS